MIDHWTRRFLSVLLLGGGLAACATAAAPPPETLYQRLAIKDATGTLRAGREAIALIVDDFVANVAKDDRTKARFASLKPAEVAKLRSALADQLCELSGGPCAYYGPPMKEVHKGMKITEAEWNATVESLVKALDKYKVPAKERQDLLAAVSPMKKDIVGQ